MNYPTLYSHDQEPTFTDVTEARDHLKRQLALAYRVFGGHNWGVCGDGHISARDPDRTDAFWLLRYGVAFKHAKTSDLVLVGPSGEVIEGDGDINMTAYFIHAPVHDARPDVMCAAHTHTGYGTPWAANAQLFTMLSQEATAFFNDQALFDDEEVQVMSTECGKRIATALGDAKLVILRNHGPLTVGGSIAEAIGWFLTAERVAETHLKATNPQVISDEGARIAANEIGAARSAWTSFQYAVRSIVPDPSVVDG